MRLRRLILGLAAFALLSAAACSSDGDSDGDETTTTAAAETADTEESQTDEDSVPPDATPLSPDELETELAGPVAAGDICAVTETFTRVTPDLTNGESYRESLRVIYEAVDAVLPSVPEDVAEPLGTVTEATGRMIVVLDSNGADLSDPAVVEMQTDENLQEAQGEFEAWLNENCG